MKNNYGYKRTAFVEMQLREEKKLRAPAAKVQQIFYEHCVKGRTQREVAKDFGCKYQYVGKCVKKMEKYLGLTRGGATMGDWMMRKGVVDHLYRERMTHIFGECLQGLRASFQRVKSVKVTRIAGKPEKQEIWERETQGNWRWADLAIKSAQMRADYEFESGMCEVPAEVDATDEENQASVARMFSEHVYLDRKPTDAELADARTVHARLEEERKLLAEERRLIAIERAEIAKLKKEMEGVLAAAKANVAESEPRPSGSGHELVRSTSANLQGDQATALGPLPDGRGSVVKEQPRPQFTWRYALREDFSFVERRRQSRERIAATVRRLGFCPPFTSGPPLEVKKGVFIVSEPHPSDDVNKAKYREEYLRQEAEAKAAGRKWREPPEKFRSDGTVMT